MAAKRGLFALPPSASSPELTALERTLAGSATAAPGSGDAQKERRPPSFYKVVQAAFDKARASAGSQRRRDGRSDAPSESESSGRPSTAGPRLNTQAPATSGPPDGGSAPAGPSPAQQMLQSVSQNFQKAVEEGMENLQNFQKAVEEGMENLQTAMGDQQLPWPRPNPSISIIGRTDSAAVRLVDPEAAIEEEFRTSSSDMDSFVEKYSAEMEKLAGGQQGLFGDIAAAVNDDSAGSLPALQQEGASPNAPLAPNKTHLVVLCNGVNGHWKDWREFLSLVTASPELSHAHFHPGQTNLKKATFDGIDVCGDRLIEEIRALAAAGSGSLTHVSLIGHSMGGLICRYVIGKLFDPATGRILGLEPAHFVTLATPHLGCDGYGESQVPLLSWAGDAPLVGNILQKAMVDAAPAFTAKIFGRAGEQLFMQDDDIRGPVPDSPTDAACSERAASAADADAPTPALGQRPPGSRGPSLIERLTTDSPEDGFYLAGLKSFRTRTAYANVSGDHVVGWANSSLRFRSELPSLEVFEKNTIFDAGTSIGSPPVPLPSTAVAPAEQETQGPAAAEQQQQQQPRSPETGRSSAGAPMTPPPRLSRLMTSSTATARPASVPSSPHLSGNASAASPSGLASLMSPTRPVKVNSYVNDTVTTMLLRLQAMSWRRVDVSYKRHLHNNILAHNHIQVTRKWLNKAGLPTVEHLLQVLVDMEVERIGQTGTDQGAGPSATAASNDVALPEEGGEEAAAQEPEMVSAGAKAAAGGAEEGCKENKAINTEKVQG